MANQVSLQSDVGSLGIAGLGAFTSLLATMSADNVQPMAMIQLEHLGAVFHVNGPYASRVPEVLKRVISHPVGRLSLTVGWRRGDTISALAETAGGQAIALLATALANIYGYEEYGMILSRLCSSLLPKSMPVSNPAQLADIAKMIAHKAAKLAFGNLLAQQTVRVLSAYEKLSLLKPPEDLLEIPAEESIIQLFESLRYLQKEKHLVRFTGSIGALYIVAIVLFMFPCYTMITVESVVIHDNDDRRIIVEISAEGPTRIQVETEVSLHQPLVSTPVESLGRIDPVASPLMWDGCLVEALRLEFGRHGLLLTQDFLESFCGFMVQIAPHIRLSDMRNTSAYAKSRKTFKSMLGPHYRRHMATVCQAICHYTPDELTSDPVEKWHHLVHVCERDLKPIQCDCGDGYRMILAWQSRDGACPRHKIWRAVGHALSVGLMCFLLRPHGSVSINIHLFKQSSPPLEGRILLRTLSALGFSHPGVKEPRFPQPPPLLNYNLFLDLLQDPNIKEIYSRIGISSHGCSIYPTILDGFEIESGGIFSFELREGAFIHDGMYHQLLSGDEGRTRESLYGTPAEQMSPITTSVLEQPMSLTASLRRGFKEVLLRLDVYDSGHYFNVAAENAILGLMCLDTTQSCEHSDKDALEAEHEGLVAVARVGMVPSLDRKVNVLMTRGDSIAQFLACGFGDAEDGHLLLNCCLNCGVRQAIEGRYEVLIA
ncbi:uncharacterized protein PG998_011749 [Apiospora kogelbergensis]|uniref:uncharacterized protein n=1 Tax=Apiospora kogelbergensis TaxID=1337665 RepID=UPI003131E638